MDFQAAYTQPQLTFHLVFLFMVCSAATRHSDSCLSNVSALSPAAGQARRHLFSLLTSGFILIFLTQLVLTRDEGLTPNVASSCEKLFGQ